MARTSNKQEEILRFIMDFMADNGYAPSIREIGAGVGLRSTASVKYHLDQLREKGELFAEPGKKRAMSAPAVREKTGQIPILGTVTAGLPILAFENRTGSLAWDGDPSCFALRVRGDSMVGAGILNGDLVVVRPQPEARDGEIVVALLEDEATVKRLRLTGGDVKLMPENPAYSPIDGKNARILGLVKAVFREY